jgi:threonine synthase
MSRFPAVPVLACHRCDWEGPLALVQACPRCGSTLLVRAAPAPDWAGTGLWRYRAALPVAGEPVTLGEGGTPLLRGAGAWLKNEAANPTLSFKDRPVAVAATVARELGAEGLLCASTGNTAVSVAAYGARAGLPVVCLVPEHTAPGKLGLVLAAGARLLRVAGSYSDAHALAGALAARMGWANLTTTYVNPFMVEGDKTVAFEIHEALGVPDAVVVPVGAGPLLAGIAKGFEELRGGSPRLFAVQAAGCAPIARAFAAGEPVRAWEAPATPAGGIADPLAGYEADGDRTLAVVRASGGAAIAVPDREIAQAADALARTVGLTVELSAAAALAGFRALLADGWLAAGDTTVLVLTGHASKDPPAAAPAETGPLVASLADAERALSAARRR